MSSKPILFEKRVNCNISEMVPNLIVAGWDQNTEFRGSTPRGWPCTPNSTMQGRELPWIVGHVLAPVHHSIIVSKSLNFGWRNPNPAAHLSLARRVPVLPITFTLPLVALLLRVCTKGNVLGATGSDGGRKHGRMRSSNNSSRRRRVGRELTRGDRAQRRNVRLNLFPSR